MDFIVSKPLSVLGMMEIHCIFPKVYRHPLVNIIFYWVRRASHGLNCLENRFLWEFYGLYCHCRAAVPKLNITKGRSGAVLYFIKSKGCWKENLVWGCFPGAELGPWMPHPRKRFWIILTVQDGCPVLERTFGVDEPDCCIDSRCYPIKNIWGEIEL